MSEIRFYHLEQQSLEQALPALLTKALAGERRVVVKAGNAQEVERLNEHLWSYNPNSFLPHGSEKDGYAEDQPVWLTTEDENPNRADILILVQGCESAMQGRFSLCCEMFDGRDEQAVSAARARWKNYKEAGHDLTYWQQGAQGWEQKTG